MHKKDEPQKRGSRFKPCQLRPLFNAIKARPKLLFGKFSDQFTQLDSQRLWEEVAEEVNADGSGPPKSGVKWAKVWSDQKRGIKARQAAIQRGLRATGGGPPDTIEPLSPLEEEITAYMGQTTIAGDESTPVPTIGRVERIAPVTVPPSGESQSSNQLASPSDDGDNQLASTSNEDNELAFHPGNGDSCLTSLPAPSSGSNYVMTPQQRLEQTLRPKRKAPPASLDDELRPAKKAAQDLQSYQNELLAIRRQELEVKMRRLELEERKVLALESIASSLGMKYL